MAHEDSVARIAHIADNANFPRIEATASKVAQHAIVAFWVKGSGGTTFDLHRKWLFENLRDLADLCGYVLVPKPVVLDEPATIKAEGAA